MPCNCVHMCTCVVLIVQGYSRILVPMPELCRGFGELLPRSPLFCAQQWMLLPMSAKCTVWSHWYPFGIRLLLTNPSPQLLITQTCKVGLLSRLVIKVHCWNTFSWVIPASPAYSQHPLRIDPSKSLGMFQLFWRNCLFHYLRVTPLSLGSPSALHCCTLQHILARDLEETHTFQNAILRIKLTANSLFFL